jgi:trehalose 6-phosphate phosphatase
MNNVDEVVAAIVSDPARAAVALDFDGTLAPIVERPEAARAVSGAPDVLRRLAARLGGLALVSGRPAADVVRFADVAEVPRIRVLGHYGLQSWRDGRLESPPPDPAIDVVRDRLRGLLAAAPDGVYVEDKQHSLVVHTRPAADPKTALVELTPAMQVLADEVGLEAVPGRYVLELRPPGVDKGGAVRQFVAEVGAAAVVYAGDDLGDVPAFRAVDQLRASGLAGLTVAVAAAADVDAPAALREQADLVLDSPAALVAWLSELADQLD